MQKYKVEFATTEYHVIDVLANSEAEAITEAGKEFNKLQEAGILHYHESRETETEMHTVYDVTNTDDPFDALNT